MNKTLIILYVIIIPIFFYNTSDAQNNEVDSLKSLVLKTEQDTVKAKLFNDLAFKYLFKEPDSALFFTRKSLSLYEKANNPKGIANSYRIIGILKSIQKKYNEAEVNYLKSASFFKKANDENGFVTLYINLGILNDQRGDYDKTIKYLDSAIYLLQNKTDTLSRINLSKVYVNRSNPLNKKGLFKEAIKSSLTAIKIKNQIGKKKGIAASYLNIGNSFSYMKEYDKALIYYKKAKNIYLQGQNNYGLINAHFNIASSHQNLGNYEKAIKEYLTLLKFMDKINVEQQKVRVFVVLGQIYDKKGDVDKAVTFFKDAENLSIKYHDELDLLSALKSLGKVYFNKNKIKLAERYSLRALKLAKKLNHNVNLIEIYKNLSEISAKRKKYSDAFTYTKQYYLLKDSIENIEVKKNVFELETKYQTAEKEKENQKLVLENHFQKEENTRIKTRNMLIIMSLLFLLLLIISIFLIIRKNQKNRFNKQLLKEIDEQNDIIAKNLHDGMSGYLHSIKNNLLLKNQGSENLNIEIDIINRSQGELRFLMKQLSSPFYRNKNFNLSDELNDLNVFYENTSDFTINSHFDKSIIWENINYQNKLQVYKLAQELLANVKKHSGASEISVQIIKDKKDLLFSIEDNGKGFETNSFKEGYGLKNITKRIKELNGEVNIESNVDKGTFISFKVPILN